MYFRSTSFWLFWLTFVGMHHNQFNTDGCFGAALQPEAAVIGDVVRQADSEEQYDSRESATINSKVSTTTTTTTTATTSIAPDEHQPVAEAELTDAHNINGLTTATAVGKTNSRNDKYNVQHSKTLRDLENSGNSAKMHDNFAFDFKENVAKLFASDAPFTKNGNSVATMVDVKHLPGRRHIVPEKLQYTKEISIKQGHLMGIVRNFHPSTRLRDVDQYLGLPYAESPVGSRRFMPPGTPLPWQGVKIARHLPPVCPQKLPDLSIQGSAKMSRGRYKHLTRLLPYLKTESEDCLYLNVYVPREDGLEQVHPYPVIVYIHGESFEWNSGNPYDGSVLASYGQVIVVTVNYRLGVMGFMKPGLDENVVANFGLLDQIAALHWIKENIAYFGGDKDCVTLMGHSTGAACVNYLMVSPVASGLFHRAILMSGSAMSDWAASNHTLQLTMQIAHSLNCPLNDDNEEMLSCLRQKRYQDILKVPTSFPQFSTSFGPIVDGHVIPNQPYKVMGQYTEHFSRYDLLFGVTESESYHTLGALALEEGLRENERDNLLRFYMQSRFDVRPDLALAATLKKYNDMYNNPIKATSQEHRDVVLDILSDARVVGPLMQTGLFHADVNRRNYMYVFGHNSAAGPHANLPHSITGEELAFIFGAPLAPAGPFHNTYSAPEKLLSEAVMAYWTNFAKTGNPKAPWKGTFINLHGLEWDRYDLDWPEFNKRTQAYINIGIPPSIGYKYRQIYMNFWNKELPDELNQIALIQQQPYLQAHYPSTQIPRGGTSSIYPTRTRPGSEVITGHMSKFGTRDNGAEDPVRTLKLLLQEPTYGQPMQVETAENMYNAPPTFGIAKQAEDDLFGMNTMPTNALNGAGGAASGSSTSIYGVSRTESADSSSSVDGKEHENGAAEEAEEEEEVAKSETTLQLLIGLIIVFIVLNVVIYSTVLLQRKKKAATTMHRKLGGILSYDGPTDDELKRSKQTTQHDGDESYVLDMVRKSNTYEAVKTERSPINGFKITRQLSSSTVDTHTKVCEWMSMAAADRKVAGTLNRLQSSPKTSKKSSSPTFSSLRGSSGGAGGTFAKHPHKISVAVDATPQGRSHSVLCQEPIELMKHKADGRNIIICQDVEVEDQELLSPQNSLDASRYSLMRQHSAATEACEADLIQQQLEISHAHSRSDPVELYYNTIRSAGGEDETVTSFCDDERPDINVTSRDDFEDGPMQSLTPEQQLLVIKRRNYPKVLPTSSGTTAARSTDSPPMTADLSTIYKRNSLPPNSFLPHFYGHVGKQAPMPPPRTISTLGRKPSVGRRNSNNITTSPLMLAQDCSEVEEEPEITQNTLIVGPIVPKLKIGQDNEGNYSTLKRKESSCIKKGDKEAHLRSNEVPNCGLDSEGANCAIATDSWANDAASSSNHNMSINKQLRRPPPPTLCLTPLTSSFQSYENRAHFGQQTETEAETHTQPAHHTEKVYSIEARTVAGGAGSGYHTPITPTTPLSPTNFSSAPTTPSTVPATSPFITTPTTPNCWGGSIGVIYAQPNKFAIKPNSTVSGKSSIPRIMPATTGSMMASEAPENNQNIANTTNCCHVMPTTGGNQVSAAVTAVITPPTQALPAATSRIPQLNRSLNTLTTQQTNKDKAMANADNTTANVMPTTTPASSTSTSTTAALENGNITVKASTPTTTRSQATSALASVDFGRTSTGSRTSSVSSASSSSASSTGTVRTELQQK